MRSWHCLVLAAGVTLAPVGLIAQDVRPDFLWQESALHTTPAALSYEEWMTARVSTAGAQSNQVVVGPTDTLWNIARTNRPSRNITIKQALLAIQDANAHAFPSNNINEMNAGSRLTIPSASAMLSRTPEEAEREVRRQNQLWVATSAPPQPQLRPVRPATEPATTASSAAPDQARVERVVEERSELREEIERLERQVAEYEQQVADYRQQVTALETVRVEPAPDQSDLQAQLEEKTARLAEKDQQIADMRQQFARFQAQAQQPAVPQPTGLTAEIQRQPLLYAGIGAGLILLLLLLVAWSSARAKVKKQALALEKAERNQREKQAASLSGELPSEDDLDSDLDESDFAPASVAATQSAPAASSKPAQAAQPKPSGTRDPLLEVEMYIAYGRLEQAAGYLVTALEQNPEREDLRLKLLEILAELDDEQEFAKQLSDLKAHSPSAGGLRRADELSRQLTQALPASAAIGSRVKQEARAEEQDDLGDLQIGVGDDDLGDLELDDMFNQPDDDLQDFDADTSLSDLDLSSPGKAVKSNFSATSVDADDLSDLADLSEDASSTRPRNKKSTKTSAVPTSDLAELDELDELDDDFGDTDDLQDLPEDAPIEFDLSELDDLDAPLEESEVSASEDDSAFEGVEPDAETDDFMAALDELENKKPVDPMEDTDDLVDLGDDPFDFGLDEEPTSARYASEDDPEDAPPPRHDLSDSFDELADLSGIEELAQQPRGDGHSYELEDLDPADDLQSLDFDLSGDEESAEFGDLDLGEASELEAEDMDDAFSLEDLESDSGLEEVSEDELSLDDFELESDQEITMADETPEELEGLESLGDEDFDLGDGDLTAQLDLATAYIEMGDKEGAREVLQRVIEEGDADLRATAQQMLDTLAS